MRRAVLRSRPVSPFLSLLLFLCVPLSQASLAQEPSTPGGNALNLTVRHVGISIGDAARVNGIRLNYRDRHLQTVNGLNLTLWRPYDDAAGTVNGLALGVPLSGAQRLRGIGIGFGIATRRSLQGVAVAPVGLGSGETVRGMAVGGLGVGAGTHFSGIGIGGLGAGAGENASGIFIGGLGAGAGNSSTGLLLGGLGAGVGDSVRGVLIGGLGAGAGGAASGVVVGGVGAGTGNQAKGLLIGGLGAGSGSDAIGLLVGGVGAGAGDSLTGIGLSLGAVGAGDHLRGIGIGGLGVGAGEHLRGLAVAGGGVGSTNVTGLSIAGGYTRIEDGRLRGGAVAAWNDIRGSQQGVTVGLYNYTRKLHGVQLGLINVARNNPTWATVLPGLNMNL